MDVHYRLGNTGKYISELDVFDVLKFIPDASLAYRVSRIIIIHDVQRTHGLAGALTGQQISLDTC